MVVSGWDNKRIASKLGITETEVKNAKTAFSIGTRTSKNKSNYHVNLIDDTENILGEAEAAGTTENAQD